jgi:hypothetical protein
MRQILVYGGYIILPLGISNISLRTSGNFHRAFVSYTFLELGGDGTFVDVVAGPV